jgi:aryl-alcohol dehydrogenase-like predicted oxidoreductase
MRRVKLGSSELEVPVICLGTMTWGQQNTEREAHEQLSYAVERGVNFLDTGEMYSVPTREQTQGSTERIIGSWVGNHSREAIIIAGKVTGPSPKQWIPPRRSPPQPAATTRMDRESIRAAVHGSLKRMCTDYIDLMELHWPERYVGTMFGAFRYDRAKEHDDVISFDEQVEAVCELIDEGKIREWGLSNETSFGVCSFVEAANRLGRKHPVSIQNDFSFLDRSFEPELAETCAPRNHNLGFLVYGALAGGTLAGKYLDGNPADARHTLWPTFQPRYHCALSRHAAAGYADIASRHGLHPATLALAWTYSREYVASTIIGATKMPQLKSCIDALDVSLSEEILEEIEQLHSLCSNPNKAARAISPGFVKDVRLGI